MCFIIRFSLNHLMMILFSNVNNKKTPLLFIAENKGCAKGWP